ncbi:4-(cytidine 5'-diphospho)-2-C-methyl-D-erythritol kinase [Candidatus Peregrinibacteria bacterium]|nr:4-(cytidine 5'-diphospho)-2-C-methyl-D-erythritol kinase [Candidatus Peregrinibacteria bacterium]
MKIKSYAKINLTLDVLKKEKGYHKILTIFQQISLHDTLIFKKISPKNKPMNLGITLTCGNPEVPLNEENTVIKAANLLLKNIPAKKQKKLSSYHVALQKKIPLRSGLGGGSSNAAATLLTLNQLWHLNLSRKKLSRLASQIGKDVPFFLHGGTAVGKNFGEQIVPLPSLPKIPIIIFLQNYKKSTKDQYAALDLKKCGRQTSLTQQLITQLKKTPQPSKNSPAKNISIKDALNYINATSHNDFETAIKLSKNPQINKTLHLKRKLLQIGASNILMSGAGPSVIAFYPNAKSRDKAYQQLSVPGQIKSSTL